MDLLLSYRGALRLAHLLHKLSNSLFVCVLGLAEETVDVVLLAL
jgi:hypothetical protein